ncbi:hypothetical protein FRB90_002863 [Tulasnella sp. 427]|nr:hypothetical protein FRB90_002863 [Tulasnella sp. 427]
MDSRRRSRGFSLSLSINSNSNTPNLLSRRQSFASVFSPASSSTPAAAAPATPGRFKRALKRLGSIRIPFTRRNSSASGSGSYGWGGMGDSDYMYDDDMDVSYEGLLRLAARIGDAKPKHLPPEFKATLPRGVYATCEAARVDDRCAICLDKYEDDHEVMGITECAHYFHSHCFETWLDVAASCPVCRRELTPEGYRFDPNATPTSPSSPISLTSYFGTLPPMSPIPPVVMEEETASQISLGETTRVTAPADTTTAPDHLPEIERWREEMEASLYQTPV